MTAFAGLCNKLVQFVLKHSKCPFLFCSLQSDLATRLITQYGASTADLTTIFVITDYDLTSSKLLNKAQAILFILECCDLPSAYLSIFRSLPRFLLDFAYDCVARTRYKIFGYTDSCWVPDEKVRHRFIDQ